MMNKTNSIFSFLAALLFLSGLACKKDQAKPVTITDPTVLTNAIDPNKVSDAQAVVSITISSDGNSPISKTGFCWSRSNQTPTIDDAAHTVNANATSGTFEVNFTNLNPYDTYYVRAFATNQAGKTAYGETKTFKTLRGTFTDNDGNVYHTITIGNQVWMQENWKDPVMGKTAALMDKLTDNTQWANASKPAFCWYGNVEANKNIYGGLYNFYAVSHADFAPNGWHVPNQADWEMLVNYSGGFNVAGGNLKDTKLIIDGGTWSSQVSVTNGTGFTALGSGSRTITGNFSSLGNDAYFWTVSGVPAYFHLSANSSSVDIGESNAISNKGLSVRLIRDTPANN